MSFDHSSMCPQDGISKTYSQPGSVSSARSNLYLALGLESPRTECSIYKGVSNRPLGWKSRQTSMKKQNEDLFIGESCVLRWDGAARMATGWDGLRRDPELWYPDGNCLVHLYAKGASRRGPAFRIPFEFLIQLDCDPLLHRFLAGYNESPVSKSSSGSGSDNGYFNFRSNINRYELYIPAPPTIQKGEAMLYHIATRNFFAWVCGKPLVGASLGESLVGLLHTMNEFRHPEADNVGDIIYYMDDEGYADIRNYPDHALAIMHFAEHFQFDNLYIDAFAHVVGMYDEALDSSEYENISGVSHSLISRARFELQIHLNQTSASLSNFLQEELSTAHLGLTAANRAHLDRFRSFLRAYWASKLGYYPPISDDGSVSFSKPILLLMKEEFHNLYDYLVDENFTPTDCSPGAAQGGICVLQSVQGFDERHRYVSLLHPLPLLPEPSMEHSRSLSSLSSRLSWTKPDKRKPEPALAALSSLSKASNCQKSELLECSFVKAFRGFEKACVLSEAKEDKKNRVSSATARKVRWIMVYAMLQTLVSVTEIPEEVRDADVPYHICIQTAGCPPWKDGKFSNRPLLRMQSCTTSHAAPSSSSSSHSTGSMASNPATSEANAPATTVSIEPDIDYTQVVSRQTSFATSAKSPQKARRQSLPNAGILSSALSISRRGTVRRALSSLGNMPTLQHPKPIRRSHHEILVQGYGNGLNPVIFMAQSERNQIDASDAGSAAGEAEQVAEPVAQAVHCVTRYEIGKGLEGAMSVSGGGSNDRMSSCWSHTSVEDEEEESERASESQGSNSSVSDVRCAVKPLNLARKDGRSVSMGVLDQMARRGMGDFEQSISPQARGVVAGDGEEEGVGVQKKWLRMRKSFILTVDFQDVRKSLEKDAEKEREEITLLEALKEGLVLS